MKRRLLCLLAALTLCLSLPAASALAETGPLTALADQLRVLMLETPNITVTGAAEFYLDGFLFKTAQGVLLQDFTDSYQEIVLVGPDRNGQNFVNGYAVSNFGCDVRVLERHNGQEYFRFTARSTKSSLIRPSMFATQVAHVACLAAESVDDGAGVVFTPSTDGSSSLTLTLKNQEMPDLVQTAANLVWQLAARHFRGLDITTYQPGRFGQLDDYDTYAEGILYATSDIRIRDLTLRFDSDPLGNLRTVSGELEILLRSPGSDPRVLTIKPVFDLGIPGETSIYSSSLVPEQLKPEEGPEDPDPYDLETNPNASH